MGFWLALWIYIYIYIYITALKSRPIYIQGSIEGCVKTYINWPEREKNVLLQKYEKA